MEEIKEDDVGKIKKKLRNYKKQDIEFNDPHFTQQLILREGNKDEVIRNILNPDKFLSIGIDPEKLPNLFNLRVSLYISL